jgi:HK97 family phage major capsid protein
VAWSDSINELVFNAGRVYSNFERIPMPAKTLTVPSQAAWGTAVLIAENTDMTVNVFADGLSGVSANYSFVAKKLGTAVHMSYEIEQDALPATLAAIPRIAARSMIRGIEDAIINGDTATGSGGIDTDVTSATSVRKAFNGLRKQAVVGGTGQFTAANCNTNVNGAALTGDMLAAHIGKAGEWGLDPSDLIWVCGPNVRSQLLTLPDKNGHALMSTVDKYGPQATILKGEVGNIFGIPVIPSPMMREDLGPEGVYTSGYGAYNQATYGTLLLVYKGAWGIGDRLQMRQEYFAFQIAQASQLASTVRLDFQNALPHFPTCTMLYGIEVHA